MELIPSPADDYLTKARYLRKIYRETAPSTITTERLHLIVNQAEQHERWEILRAEYEFLFGEPSRAGALERITTDAYSELHGLAGQVWDSKAQKWRNPDGSLSSEAPWWAGT